MIELNLLPDIKQEFVRARRQKRLVIATMTLVSIIAVATVVLIGFYAYGVQNVRQGIADKAIKDESDKLKKQKNLVRNLTIQNQLASISELHETKNIYERLFDYLRALNPEEPNNVSISKVTIDSVTGTMSIEASALNYQAVTVFKDTLNEARLKYDDPESEKGDTIKTRLFTEVTIGETGIGKNSEGKQVAFFKATLVYDPNAFAWTTKGTSVEVPNKKTNQSSSNVPIFADSVVKKEGQE